MSPTDRLAQELQRVFGTPNVPERNRYIQMLRAFAELMRELGFPNEWYRKTFELGLALGELGEGITPELLRPAKRTEGGRPSDEWRIWIVRSRAVLALEARLNAKMPRGQAVKEMKKRFPDLAAAPYVEGGELKTSLSNWERTMGDIKRGDHLDLVAEQHEEARAAFSGLTLADAISVADELLNNALR